jgi:hypothetical protein
MLSTGDLNICHRSIDWYMPPVYSSDGTTLDHVAMEMYCQVADSFLDQPARSTTTDVDVSDGHSSARPGPARLWLNSLLQQQFVDCFRHLNPSVKNAFTCWNLKTNARARNQGTRIDYILASSSLAPALKRCEQWPDVNGSDHCPVVADFDLTPAEAPNASTDVVRKSHVMSARFFEKFDGSQPKLSFFKPVSTSAPAASSATTQPVVVESSAAATAGADGDVIVIDQEPQAKKSKVATASSCHSIARFFSK